MPVKTSHWLSTKNNRLEKMESEHGRGTKYNRYPQYPVGSQMQCARPSCVQAHMESLHWWAVWDIFEEDKKHDKYAVAVHLNNCLTVVGHIPREITHTCHFFIKNKGETDNWWSKRKMTALHSSLWRCRRIPKYHACSHSTRGKLKNL